MANSKSNIYPIQLQGAELCLNRYDAEIKQYSGFNKNNSPFVGGCLSNIFTKDEVIEGATKDSVYIAPNGDIWRVDNTGLYRNDELIIAKESDALKIEEKEMPAKLYYYYNDEVYLTQEEPQAGVTSRYPSYKFHCGEYEDIISPFAYPYIYYSSFDIEHIYDETLGDIYCVAWQAGAQTDNAGVLKILLYIKDSEDNVTKQTFEATATDFFVTENVKDSIGKVCVFPLNDDNVIGFFVSGSGATKRGLVYNGLEWNLFNGYMLTYSTVSDVTHYDIENYSFYKKNYYGNVLACRITIGSSGQNVYANITKIYFNNNFIRFVFDWLPLTGGHVWSEQKNTFKTHYGNLSIVKTSDSGGGICGYTVENKTHPSKIGDDEYQVNLGCIIGGFILMNNNMVSGLSLGGNILLTEWNSVDTEGNYVYYFYDRQELIYKNIINGKWYKISAGSPTLKFANNQIITNFNQMKNAYSLKREKVVMFASAFNNRQLSASGTTATNKLTAFSEADNNCYIAFSINEYNLEDNASILLNPVAVTGSGATSRTYTGVKFNFNDGIVVNEYSGANSNSLYYQSYLMNDNKFESTPNKTPFFINKDLENLPFPSDTNGNVAYSPSLFAEFFSSFGNDVFIREGTNSYQLSRYDNQPIMSFYLGTLIEGLTDVFILQGQYYGIINNQIFAIQFYNGAVASQTSVVSVLGLQFCGNTPYEALFFSKTNRCLYSFTGANILTTKQFIDKIDVVKGYKYNPATQSIFLLTNIGVIVFSLFGIYQIEMPEVEDLFLLDNGIVLTDNLGNFRYVRYYKEDTDDTYLKHNIKLETCFYGMNNQTVTINDCLYMRIFSEEHEQGDLEVSATTLSLKGRKTEKTVFKIKASDWDKETNTIYLRYQPKEQRGLGISFSINSPFKIAALSVGSQADAILVDKVSKGAINAPSVTSNNLEW